MALRKSNCGKTYFKLLQNWNGNCDKTQKFKMWQLRNSNVCQHTKTKNMTIKKTEIVQNPNREKTKTQIVTNTQKLKFLQLKNSNSDSLNLLVRTTWHLNNRWDVLWAAFCDIAMFSIREGVKKKPLNLWSWSYLAGPPPSFLKTVITLRFFCVFFATFFD